MAVPTLYLSGVAEADRLLATNPTALLIGMVVDQQIPMERAFAVPAILAKRLGVELDAGRLAAMDPAKLRAAFVEKPALHRFPAAMADRVQAMCQMVVDDYDGDAAQVWLRAKTGAALLANLKALPGFGAGKAAIFMAFLGKQLQVQPPGWQELSKPFGDPGTFHSLADIVDEASFAQVRISKQAHKAQMRAEAEKKVGGRPTTAAAKKAGKAGAAKIAAKRTTAKKAAPKKASANSAKGSAARRG